MLPAAITLSPAEARRWQRRLLLLDQRVNTVAAAISHHGYVQIDPINVCGRMHDLILRTRVAGYREGDLMRHLHGENAVLGPEQRTAFEHHLPSTGILVAFGLEAWPHLQTAMHQRSTVNSAWSGRLAPKERELAKTIFAELEAGRGPLNSDSFNDGQKARSVWGSATLAKATLQKLFFHGKLLIARRDGNRRFYDLPERVLPAAVLAQAEASAEDRARWLVQIKLRQRRLVSLTRKELALVEELVQPVRIEGCPGLYCLSGDVAWLEQPLPTETEITEPRLIAPLDPLIYDRALTRRLWGFEYTWEVYVPEAKRVRGYYALPVLAGTELVGHVEPKADREAAKLKVVSRSVPRGIRSATAVRELATFLGLKA